MKKLRTAGIAGLLMMIGAPVAAQPAAQTILVWSFGFSPHPIHLDAGRRVTLYFVNRSGSRHDFTAGQFFTSSVIVSGDAHGGEVELGPHETKRINLIPRAGNYPAHCSQFFHKQMGMSDEIVVD